MHASYPRYPRALSHSIAPGYCLAQGKLAGALPLVGLAMTATELTTDEEDCLAADPVVAARHGRAAERYADLLGRSRGMVMKASQLLSLANLASARPSVPICSTATCSPRSSGSAAR